MCVTKPLETLVIEPAPVLQQEIVDETDIYEDVNTGLRRGGQRVDVANLLAMFEHKLNHLQVSLAFPTESRAQIHVSWNEAIFRSTEADFRLNAGVSVYHIIYLSEVNHSMQSRMDWKQIKLQHMLIDERESKVL